MDAFPPKSVKNHSFSSVLRLSYTPPSSPVAIGMNSRQTKKEITTKIVVYFTVVFIVTCPGPKNSGEGTAADGVTAAIPDAIETMMVNAAMFTWSMDSSTAPILKNSTMVTVLDRKFVMMMASRTVPR